MTDQPETVEVQDATAILYRDAPSWDAVKTAAIGDFRFPSVAAGSRLLAETATRLRKEGFKALLAPMSGDTWHSYRVVTQSDGSGPFAMEPTSGDYDLAALETSGFSEIERYVSTRARLQDTIGAVATEVDGVTIAPWDGADAEHFIHTLFDMSSKTFSQNRFFKPISRDSFLALYRPIIPLIDKDHVLFAHGEEGQMIGFLFGIPNLMDTSGKPSVILKSYASGRRGVGHLLADFYHRRTLDMGFSTVIHALMHEDNVSLERSARHGAEIFRRYALMGRKL